MNEIYTRLLERDKAGNLIRVAIVGAGQMGTEIITQIGEMKGIEVSVVVDLKEELARKGFSYSKKQYNLLFTNSLNEAEDGLRRGKTIITENYQVATRLSLVDAVVDATGSIELGVLIGMDCIDNKKHIVMMNVECDATVGPVLRKMAENAGVVYSMAAGDEPAAIMDLFRFAKSLGFEVITAGKGKNNPLNIYATPETEAEKAKARNMSPRMLCEFVDGSKTAIEMASVSNATGLITDIPGMHGAAAKVPELSTVFIPEVDGGILHNRGVVDFSIGVHPGVFVIFYTDNARIQEGLVQRDMGNGPYYTLYRPFHLCSIEVPLTIAQVVLYNESHGHPQVFLTSECTAITKRNIKAGEILDGIGEYCYRVSIDNYSSALASGYIPAGLVHGTRAKTDIPIDTVLRYDMVEFLNDSVLLQLRKIQDKIYVQ